MAARSDLVADLAVELFASALGASADPTMIAAVAAASHERTPKPSGDSVLLV